MAGHPAAMTTVEAIGAVRLADVLADVATLLRRAYPAGSLRMDAAYLAWALTDRNDLALSALSALAHEAGRPVGFAGAAPVHLQLGDRSWPAHLVSFVATDPLVRGRGVAGRLYEVLLDALAADRNPACVLTYAQCDSPGAALIERCYPRQGWFGARLETMAPWGIARRRIAAGTDGPTGTAATEGELRIAADEGSRAWLARDPRLVLTTDQGIRVLALPLVGPGDPVVGSLDSFPGFLTSAALGDALSAAAASLPQAVTQVIVPNLPEAAADVARAVGLRRLPGQPWCAWAWSRNPSHPVLGATRSAVPVT